MGKLRARRKIKAFDPFSKSSGVVTREDKKAPKTRDLAPNGKLPKGNRKLKELLKFAKKQQQKKEVWKEEQQKAKIVRRGDAAGSAGGDDSKQTAEEQRRGKRPLPGESFRDFQRRVKAEAREKVQEMREEKHRLLKGTSQRRKEQMIARKKLQAAGRQAKADIKETLRWQGLAPPGAELRPASTSLAAGSRTQKAKVIPASLQEEAERLGIGADEVLELRLASQAVVGFSERTQAPPRLDAIVMSKGSKIGARKGSKRVIVSDAAKQMLAAQERAVFGEPEEVGDVRPAHAPVGLDSDSDEESEAEEVAGVAREEAEAVMFGGFALDHGVVAGKEEDDDGDEDAAASDDDDEEEEEEEEENGEQAEVAGQTAQVSRADRDGEEASNEEENDEELAAAAAPLEAAAPASGPSNGPVELGIGMLTLQGASTSMAGMFNPFQHSGSMLLGRTDENGEVIMEEADYKAEEARAASEAAAPAAGKAAGQAGGKKNKYKGMTQDKGKRRRAPRQASGGRRGEKRSRAAAQAEAEADEGAAARAHAAEVQAAANPLNRVPKSGLAKGPRSVEEARADSLRTSVMESYRGIKRRRQVAELRAKAAQQPEKRKNQGGGFKRRPRRNRAAN